MVKSFFKPMAKVDFYTIQQSTQEGRDFFACRLVEKVYNQGHKIYIHTESETVAQELDDLLWSFRPESFIPHAITGNEEGEDVPVIIGYGNEYSGPKDVLINLSLSIPSFHHEFQRIAEIVINDEAIKQTLREHWKQYQDLGYELQQHQL